MKPTEEHFKIIKQRWGFDGEIKFLRRVENFVYEMSLPDRPAILRLTEPKHRSAAEIKSELDWMDFLSKSRMKIAAPIASRTGSLVETIEADETFHASVFEKALGQPLKTKEDFSLSMLETWGRYIAKMHQLTQEYKPSNGIQPRSLWSEDSGFQVTLQGVDKSDPLPYQRFHEFMDWFQSLETDSSCFGLVHCDLHHGNFFVNNGEITAFDFDDCVYHWFAYDLAIPLYYLLKKSEEGTLPVSYEKSREAYLNAYSQVSPLDSKWLNRVDLFLKFRVVAIYHWVKASMESGVFQGESLEWCKKILPWNHKQLQIKLHFQ